MSSSSEGGLAACLVVFDIFNIFLSGQLTFWPAIAASYIGDLFVSVTPVLPNQAKVVPIPKGYLAPLLPVTDQYVWASFVSSFWRHYGTDPGCQPPTSLIGNVFVLVILIRLCTIHDTLQGAQESEQEARIVHFDFSASYDMVNHKKILFILLYGFWMFCVVYSDSFFLIGPRKSWWVAVGVNLTCCRECFRAVSLACYLWAFLHVVENELYCNADDCFSCWHDVEVAESRGCRE